MLLLHTQIFGLKVERSLFLSLIQIKTIKIEGAPTSKRFTKVRITLVRVNAIATPNRDLKTPM